MDYHVILIECFRPTHRWLYSDLQEALDQLYFLLNAYQEVNEVTATIVKAGHCERDCTCSELLLNQINRPDFDLE